MKTRIHAFISGRVQGVFFRATTRRVANKLGIKGWVKNLPDGRVEVVAEGDEETINELIKFLKKGPSTARVDNVEIETQDFKDEFESFGIRY